MTGNISYLSEYEPYDGGYVSFGHGGGKITSKGIIKTDSDYGGATQDRKSTTRGCQFMGKRLISWKCKKQTIVATSTTKAEYVAAASGCGQFVTIPTHIFNSFLTLIKHQFHNGEACFCDYHNMVSILEKTEHNTDFHQILNFLEASHIRYALTISPTVYVSHIRQFWSTARIETTNQETKILATVDGKPQTISESSLRRHLKLNDEEGISSLPDIELFENLLLMGYNILPNQRFTFQKGQFSHQWKFLIHTIMQYLSPGVVCLATNRVYNFSKMIFDGMMRNLNSKGTKILMYPRVNSLSFSGRTVPLFASMIITQGEGSENPTEPNHTPSPQEQHSPHHDSPPSSLPTTTSEPIPQAPTETHTPRRYTRRAIRVAQSKALSPTADEPASLSRDDRQGEAFLTVSSLDAGQDRENIAKTSALPHDSSPRVTSLDADEGNLEISGLKARVKSLEDKERRSSEPTQEDAPITRGIMEIGEELGADKSTELGSNDTEKMVNILSSMEVTNILTSGGATATISPGDVLPTAGVPTVSGSFSTVSAIFIAASVVTSYTRRSRGITIGSLQPMRSPIIGAKDKGKEKVVESEVLKKRKLQEQIDARVAREMEKEFARENPRLSEQLTRDSEIARLHAKEELKIMIEGLDRNNEVIGKHLREYEQAAADLSVGEKLELISELVKYQDHRAKILKYQAQQSKPLLKKEQREFYMSVLKSHAGWKTKHFRGMTLEEIKEKFIPVWKQLEYFVPMSLKQEIKGVMGRTKETV
nr:ribonuclease H-like domain, reverse transcriptase, RNA-dependent DNA polymerase [Tanacetum cinerariifolium]